MKKARRLTPAGSNHDPGGAWWHRPGLAADQAATVFAVSTYSAIWLKFMYW